MGEPLLFIFVVLSYLAGSIPFGKIIARMAKGLDISAVGSRNIGATNVAREIGLKWGLLTLLLDCLKGLGPSAAAFAFYKGDFNPATVAAVSGLAAFIGHQFSLFLKFKGGKGVATALGVFLVLCPLCVAGSLALFVVLVYFMGYISLASMGASAAMPFFLLLSTKPPMHAGVAFLISGLIALAHRDNIRRLLQKQEPKWRRNTPM
jgi:glycerol-3-phosphate acyltransferase PlsY